jgi:hypothetical protein
MLYIPIPVSEKERVEEYEMRIGLIGFVS